MQEAKNSLDLICRSRILLRHHSRPSPLCPASCPSSLRKCPLPLHPPTCGTFTLLRLCPPPTLHLLCPLQCCAPHPRPHPPPSSLPSLPHLSRASSSRTSSTTALTMTMSSTSISTCMPPCLCSHAPHMQAAHITAWAHVPQSKRCPRRNHSSPVSSAMATRSCVAPHCLVALIERASECPLLSVPSCTSSVPHTVQPCPCGVWLCLCGSRD